MKFIRIDGSTPAQTRGDLVNKFQQNSDVRVAILSINAAGTGLTLTVSPAHCLSVSAMFSLPHATSLLIYGGTMFPVSVPSLESSVRLTAKDVTGVATHRSLQPSRHAMSHKSSWDLGIRLADFMYIKIVGSLGHECS